MEAVCANKEKKESPRSGREIFAERRLLNAFRERGKTWAVSPALLAEYYETIEELRLEYPRREPVEWVDALTESAELIFLTERATGATPDPGDEMVLECALAAEADYIVSGDKKHLLALREFRGIRIVSPSDFLRRLAI